MNRRDRAVMTSIVLEWGDRGVTAKDFYAVLYLYNLPDTSINEEDTLSSQRAVRHIKVGLFGCLILCCVVLCFVVLCCVVLSCLVRSSLVLVL